MSTNELFGNLIKNLRNKQSLSQEGLSDKTGLDRTYISLLERGKKNPSLLTILKICKALGILPSELMITLEKENILSNIDGGSDES
jgi:transcriptional regulator with XRE-family HTH domain